MTAPLGISREAMERPTDLVATMRAAAAEQALSSEGELWSFLRSCMSQGVDIWQDAKSHELYSARLDAAASERARHLWAALSALAAPTGDTR